MTFTTSSANGVTAESSVPINSATKLDFDPAKLKPDAKFLAELELRDVDEGGNQLHFAFQADAPKPEYPRPTTTATTEATAEVSSTFTTFVLKQLRCAELRAELSVNQIRAATIALSAGLITPETAIEPMPSNVCQIFYDCRGCGARLKAKPGDCVVRKSRALLSGNRGASAQAAFL